MCGATGLDTKNHVELREIRDTETCMVVVSTRPEIIKMAPIIRALIENSLPFVFVHCGQHYDYNMSQQFIDELELSKPDYCFKVKAYSPGTQTARILTIAERVIKKVRPKTVLVEGDTNGVLASALASVKLSAPVGHVEAGLRSFDLRMPEEHNRRLVDHLSTYLFAPTLVAKANLVKENVWGRLAHLVGTRRLRLPKPNAPTEKAFCMLEKGTPWR